MAATNEQIKDWARRLRALADEADQAYGEPRNGCYEDRVPITLRFAWDAVMDEQKRRTEALASPIEPLREETKR